MRLVGPFQDVLLYSLPETWGAFDLSELPGGPNDIWGQVRARDRNAVLEVATLPLGGGTVLQVGKTSETRDQLLSNFRRVLLLGAAAAVAIGFIGGIFLTRSTLKPLRDLRDTVQRILHTGQTDDRVPVYGSDDAVDELSGLFNAMLARITTLIHGMRNALDHVAHDLRTPMTRMRVTAESALATNDPARHREALSDCLEESDRVLSMLTTLMDISEAETGTMKLNRSQVDLGVARRRGDGGLRRHRRGCGRALAVERAARPDRQRRPRSAAASAGQPRRQRDQVHAGAAAASTWKPREAGGSVSLSVQRHRRRHCRARSPENLGSPVPRRPKPHHPRPGPWPEPGPRLGRSPGRHGRGKKPARPWLDFHHHAAGRSTP